MDNLLTSKEEFQRWAEHPGTKAFLAYLLKRQAALMEAWGRGASLVPEQQAQAVLLGQMAGLNSDDIAHEYGVERPEVADEQ